MDVSMKIEGGFQHAVFTQRHVGANKVILFKDPPHCDLLEVSDQIAFDDIVVAYNQPLLTIQLGQHRVRTWTTHSNVAEVIYLVLRLDSTVPVVNHELVHLLYIIKLTDLLALVINEVQKIRVRKMCVTDEPNVSIVAHALAVSINPVCMIRQFLITVKRMQGASPCIKLVWVFFIFILPSRRSLGSS